VFSKFIKGLVLIYIVFTLPFSYFTFSAASAVGEVSTYDVGLVLGAGIACGWNENVLTCKPSTVLKNRLDKALELYNQNKIKKILVSGNGENFYYNETKVMSSYLLKNNVKMQDIMVDYEGDSTLQSCENAKNIFNLERVLVFTQAFHLSRSVFLCREVGLKVDAEIAADSSPVTTNYGLVREIPASWKALGLNI
jgi:vancomycin permeability regulator SanA